jgi:hypothetical protein
VTPERIQFLRATIGSEAVAAVEAEWDEMLDEIERLRGEVALLESFHIKQTDRLIDEHEAELERLRQLVRNPHTLEGVNVPFCGAGGCAWTASPNMAGASHAAHIEELLNGSAA